MGKVNHVYYTMFYYNKLLVTVDGYIRADTRR